MNRVILGTAGHIDHGKTALVAALTGTDTDRLKEEKERGITIELGFASLKGAEGPEIGVVDVPGHEAFVRTMVAGATGMDLVLLVVAADEGVMPQTREHLAILELLGVRGCVVALTKADLVDEEWLALVDDDVADILAKTPFHDAPRLPVSSTTGDGISALREALAAAASGVVRDRTSDLARLPIDRVFTVQGTGTVVTGTLWSGQLRTDERVRLLPGDHEVRIRGLQVHGAPVDHCDGGDRTAVALTGTGLGKADLQRGLTLVTDGSWSESWMLTVKVEVLPDAPWSLEHNQRVRVHLGTAEVMARVALLEEHREIQPDGTGWIQLRLESPVMARCGDRLILRSYSPLRTLGGGVVAEPTPRKRKVLTSLELAALDRLLGPDIDAALVGLLESAGWQGIETMRLPVLLGRPPQECEAALARAAHEVLSAGSRTFAASVVAGASALITARLETEHAMDPLMPEVPLSRLRAAVPGWAPDRLADAVLQRLNDSGAVELVAGGARLAGHAPTPTSEQETACAAIAEAYRLGGLAPPGVDELPDGLGGRSDVWSLLRRLESDGRITSISDGLYIDATTLDEAIARVRSELAGRSDLGPADFRVVMDVSRKHLIPLLKHMDGLGVTLLDGQGRSVPAR